MRRRKQLLVGTPFPASGLEGVDVQIEDEAVRGLIKWWCRESGVRGLKKQIEKVRISICASFSLF